MKYNARYDSEYDEIEDMWLQPACPEPECYFCEARPAKPSEATERLTDGQPHVEHY